MPRLNKRVCWTAILPSAIFVSLMVLHLINDGGNTGLESGVVEASDDDNQVEEERLDTTEWRTPTPDERLQGWAAVRRRLAKNPILLRNNTNNNETTIHQQRKVKRILIATTWRSGSTFFSELLHSLPATYNHYEPLMQFHLEDLRQPPLADQSVDIVAKLLQCRYQQLETYMDFAKQREEMISRNFHLWNVCKMITRALCFDAQFLEDTCHMFPIQVMKTVRLPLFSVGRLLERADLEDLKVVFLVRDPRATLNSRKRMDWCTSPICSSPQMLCQMLEANYDQAIQLEKTYPRRFTVLRYEDLATDPLNVAQSIFEWLDLPWLPEVERFIDTHTKRDLDQPWSTFRMVGSRVSAWKNDTSWKEVHHTQQVCAKALKLFGYLPVGRDNLSGAETVTTFPQSYLLDPQ